jgi:3-oxoacyl-[acyl-carrier protein] reductase
MGMLDGRVAVITGSGRGIGREFALSMAGEGAKVVVNDVGVSLDGRGTDEDPAANVCKEIEALGGEAVPSYDSVTEFDAAARIIGTAVDAFGKIDILVNNAGVTRDDLIMRMTEEAWREVLETNLFGAFWMTKAVTRPMLKARSGRIVNITSVSGQAGQMGQANYSSAKAGLIGLTKASARELASRSITVNAVAPGFVLTELTQDLPDALKDEITNRTPLARFGTTEEIANAVAFLVSDEAAFITGQVLGVDGGLVMM